MFTGLVEAICRVESERLSGSGVLLEVDLGRLAAGSNIGDSIAVNGVCLTIAQLRGSVACFEVSGETLSRSNLGQLGASSLVNVEQSLRAGGRFGGHFVQGHIDGTGLVTAIERRGEFADITFTAGRELTGQMVEKGSVAVDGVSLTIAWLREESFGCALIPQSLAATTLGKARRGDVVNVEVDIIVKAVHRQMQQLQAAGEGLTIERFRELGF